MRRHYHVNTFLPGCLNDGSEGPFTNLRDALAEATSLARSWRDNGYRVTGNQLSGYTTHTELGYIGYRIVVEDCTEPRCMEDQ